MMKQFMKLLNISLCVLLIGVFSSCIKDSKSCSVDSRHQLVLDFEHRDKNNLNVFSKVMHKVSLFVFDEYDELIYRTAIDKASLKSFAGASLHLDPGKYRVVCWGNAMEYTTFGGIEVGSNLINALVQNSANQEKHAVNGDPLYYVSLDLDLTSLKLSSRAIIHKTISFCRAHTQLEVLIDGFEDQSEDGENLPPLVEIRNLSSNYDFNMQSSGSHLTFSDLSSYSAVDEKWLARATFYTPMISDDTSVEVLIKKQSDKSLITTISLKDFIKEHNIQLNTCHQTTIPILVEYKSTDISISLPGWAGEPVDPEIN